jgi:hypothetical protein
VERGKDALTAMLDAKDNLSAALQDLEDLRSEYEEWKDNLPEFAQGGAMADKLEAVSDLQFDPDTDDMDEASSQLDEAEGADLPLGFGRD